MGRIGHTRTSTLPRSSRSSLARSFHSCGVAPSRWRFTRTSAPQSFGRCAGRTSIWSTGRSTHRARDRVSGEDKSTKTKQTRRFTLEPAILPLLRTMHAEAEEEGHGRPTDHVVELTSERDLARGLKRWLRKADIKRAELYATDATRQALRFHDLRATGITWMAVRGDAPQVIQSRAGHTDYTTTLGYIREAETLAAGFGEVFPALPLLETDWAKDRAKSRKQVPKYSESLRGGRDSNAFGFRRGIKHLPAARLFLRIRPQRRQICPRLCLTSHASQPSRQPSQRGDTIS